jgi:hypothetical protein
VAPLAKAPLLLVGLLALASFIPLSQAGNVETFHAVVWTPDAGAVAVLGADVVESYEAFLLVEATALELHALRSQWLTEVVSSRIVKGAVDFDTAQGDLEPGEGLEAGADEPYLLVQVKGPVKAAWREALLAHGDLLDYVPYNSYVLRAPGQAEAVRALPFVAFVGPFHAAYKLDPRVATFQGPATWDVAVWGGEALAPVEAQVLALGGTIEGRSERAFESYLRITLDAAQVSALARVSAVGWIEPFVLPADPLDNAQAAWVTQSGLNPTAPGGGATVHAKGLTGRGQVLADADTGLDTDSASNPTRFVHDAFHDATVQFVWGALNPQHRKVLAYYRLTEGGVVKGDYDDSSGHGTHTSGSIAADLAPFLSYNNNDGQSFGGKFVFMDWSSLPVDYFNMFDPTYQAGARLHSNSYGGSHNNAYTLPARQNDEYTWTHQDFLIFRSMGNTAGNTIRPEAVAKNVVSSGATQNGDNAINMAGFSSRGPTQDLRVKPTVVAPGEGVTSTYLNNGYSSLSGTSMSTPTTAGASGLIRQYFAEGWHGGTGQGSAPGFDPSAALVRGVLINSAVPISGLGTARPGLTSNPLEVAEAPCQAGICPSKVMSPGWPNGDMGWGLMRLDNTLRLPGDSHGLAVVDGASVGTGQAYTRQVQVADPSKGLKITLAWSDAPATVGANPTLVNDLDLVVVLPGGLEVKGNVFLGSPNLGTNNNLVNRQLGELPSAQVIPPQSAPGGSPDRRNVEEQVVFPSPVAGTYTIKVVGHNVPSGAQPFALVAAGGI